MDVLLIIMFVVGAPLQLLVHEGAHALAAKLTGGRVLGFRPYPHVHRSKFYFGRVTISGGDKTLFFAAPLFAAFTVALAGYVCMSLTAAWWLSPLVIWANIDIAWYVSKAWWGSPSADINRVPGFGKGFAALMLVVAALNLAAQVFILLSRP